MNKLSEPGFSPERRHATQMDSTAYRLVRRGNLVRFSLLSLMLLAPALGTASESEHAAPAVDMQLIRLDEWNDILTSFQPNIVVVDLWASWCVSCIERFPEMVTMAERYAESGVSFVTLNLDDPKDDEGIAWSNEFLTRMSGDFTNYHLQENLTESFEALDLLAIPVVLIYDRIGNERYRLTNDNPNNQFSDEDIERSVQQLLEEIERR